MGSMSLGGAAKLIKYSVEHADPQVYRVSVACLETLGEYGRELSTRGYLLEEFKLSRSWFRIVHNIGALIKLYVFIRQQQVDVLNAHLFFPGIIGRVYGKMLNIPVVMHTTHNIMYPRWEPRINRLLERFTTTVVVDSIAVKEKLIRAGQDPDKVQVIYNGIDEAEFAEDLDPSSVRKQLNIPTGDFVLGNIAGLQYYKGHDFLLEVFARLNSIWSNVHLILVGDGALTDQLMEQARRLNVFEKVHFLGRRSDIAALIRSMDLMVHPSRWEGFGIILAEAMYCGVPIVCSDRGGIPEVVEDKACGFIHPFGEVDAFVRSIAVLLGDKNLRKRFAENGHRRVKNLFTLDIMMANYSKLYQATLERTRSLPHHTPLPESTRQVPELS